MYILEITIVFLLLLLLYSTGWLVRVFQILFARLLDFARAVVESLIKDEIEKPVVKKRSKKL